MELISTEIWAAVKWPKSKIIIYSLRTVKIAKKKKRIRFI